MSDEARRFVPLDDESEEIVVTVVADLNESAWRARSDLAGFSGWLVGDLCDHNVPGRSRSREPYGGEVRALEKDGGLPYAQVRWPDGVEEHVLLPEHLTPAA